MKERDVEWCRYLFGTLAEGGVWGLPRTGLIFQKQSQALVLIARMPHEPDMPLSSGELSDMQKSDFLDTKQHFEAAGIPVRDASVVMRARAN